MSAETQAACDAVAAKISAIAGKHTQDRGEVEQLKTLAKAASDIHFGPQGGAMDYHYNYKADYHETKHDGEARDRPPTGFGDANDHD